MTYTLLHFDNSKKSGRLFYILNLESPLGVCYCYCYVMILNTIEGSRAIKVLVRYFPVRSDQVSLTWFL